MPVNPEQLFKALQAMGESLAVESAAERTAQAAALQALHSYSTDFTLAERAAAIAARSDPNLRCALPVAEKIDAGYSPGPVGQAPTIIAVDGSQITPDRHAELLFGLINIGTVVMRMDSGETPATDVEMTLLFGKRLYPKDGPLMSEGEIALLRDKGERASLLRHAPHHAHPPIALTDGPLELWGAKDVSDPGAFEQALAAYLGDLREMEHRRWTVAGYVDKPGADLVIRLFEVLQAGPEQMKSLRSYHPLRGASDRWLFGQVLAPAQRSAVFAIQSSSKPKYSDGLAIHFFYLNVGSSGHPALARVEIPKWVAESPTMLDSLHSTLVEQCRLLGARPYPYVLHRAHETAKIGLDEKEQIKLKLLLEHRRRGLQVEDPSGKSIAKSTSEIKGSY